VLHGCLIKAKEGSDIQVPAQDAGLLVGILFRVGSDVKKGDVLAQIDDTEPKMRGRVALYQKNKADTEAKNDIRVRYARKAAEVSKQEHANALKVNATVRDAIPKGEVRRLKLAWDQADLQIENSILEQELSSLEVKVKQAEVDAAREAIERRKIKARFDGTVAEIYAQAGEWVQAGQPILQLINTNEMLVKGTVNSSEYDPQDIEGRKVTVQVTLARGRTIPFTGTVIHVGSVERATGFDVWASIPNQLENGRPVLRDGMTGDMTIHVK
jgi:macrolide-specific efflux system membrane fusion protein